MYLHEFYQQQVRVVIQTEPVQKHALKVLCSILAIISPKSVPTQKTQEGSVYLYQDKLVLHHCTEEYFPGDFIPHHTLPDISWQDVALLPENILFGYSENILFVTDSQGNFCFKSPAWGEYSCWLRWVCNADMFLQDANFCHCELLCPVEKLTIYLVIITPAITVWRVNWRATAELRSICIKSSQLRCYLGAEHLTAHLQCYYKAPGMRERYLYSFFSSKDGEGQNATSPPGSHKMMSMWGAGCQLEVHGSVSSLASAPDGEGKRLLNFTTSEHGHDGTRQELASP